MKKKIAILGCGNLGMSIANGLLMNPDFNSEFLSVSKRNPVSLAEFLRNGVQVFDNNSAAIQQAELIVIAVKPYDVQQVLEDIKESFDPQRQILISVATGISIAEINKFIPEATVFRAMPNIAADVMESITCISTNSNDEKKRIVVENLFEHIGKILYIKEELMEAATVLGACGIAYVLRFMRSMVQGGIQIGFDSKTATEIVNQVMKGTACLLIENKEHAEKIIDRVTTPKGCTIVGLNEMEHNGFSSALIRGISTSYAKIEK